MKKLVNIALLAALVALSINGVFAVPVVKAQTTSLASASYVPGEILIKTRTLANLDSEFLSKYALNSAVNFLNIYNFEDNTKASLKKLGLDRVYLLKTDEDILKVIDNLTVDPIIEIAEPNFTYQKQTGVIPNDTYFGEEWGLNNSLDTDIDAVEAWGRPNGGTGDLANSPLIAVLDTGIDYNHPDLTDNIVSTGRDFIANDFDAMDEDPKSHGTKMAGVIGAKSNNSMGIAGVNWFARMVPVRVLDANGGGDAAKVMGGISWSAANGAKIINMSFGSYNSQSSLIKELIDSLPNVLFVAASGNNLPTATPVNGLHTPVAVNNMGTWNNNDIHPYYPASYDSPNLIAVTSTNDLDHLTGNYGTMSVDIAAPEESKTTIRGGEYALAGGTSIASAFVTGALSLYWSYNPAITVSQIKTDMILYADRRPFLTGTSVSGGRLNIDNMFTRPLIPSVKI